MTTFIDRLLHSVHEDTPDSPESLFYWDKLFESVEALADPRYDKGDVSNHLYDIAAPYGSAERLQGWKQGIGFALRLVMETLYTPDMTRQEAEKEYKSYGRPLNDRDGAADHQ